MTRFPALIRQLKATTFRFRERLRRQRRYRPNPTRSPNLNKPFRHNNTSPEYPLAPVSLSQYSRIGSRSPYRNPVTERWLQHDNIRAATFPPPNRHQRSDKLGRAPLRNRRHHHRLTLTSRQQSRLLNASYLAPSLLQRPLPHPRSTSQDGVTPFQTSPSRG